MKSTIIILGIAALSFNYSTAATALKDQNANQQEISVINADSTQQIYSASVRQNQSTTGVDSTTEESQVFNPAAVINAAYTKPIEAVVIENKLITDSQEESNQPLSIDKTQQDYINEANQIIESNPNSQAFPLDFEAINQAVKNEKKTHHAMATAIAS